MAAEIKEALNIDVDFIKGSGGVFEVKVDDNQVFSKAKVGRFPNFDEVVGLIQKK